MYDWKKQKQIEKSDYSMYTLFLFVGQKIDKTLNQFKNEDGSTRKGKSDN